MTIYYIHASLSLFTYTLLDTNKNWNTEEKGRVWIIAIAAIIWPVGLAFFVNNQLGKLYVKK